MENITNRYATFQEKQKNLVNLLDRAEKITSSLDMENATDKLNKLKEKVSNDKFKVMVVGTFKNGKSTFINSFLGEDILPAYSLPCTAVINEVKYDKDKHSTLFVKEELPEKLPSELPQNVKAHFDKYNNHDIPPMNVPVEEIEDYVVIPMGKDPSEMLLESPYEKLELYWPLPLLENGVEIIDSPGLNEHATRTKVTMDYLSKADAILFVLNAQAICSQDEMNFIENSLYQQNFRSPFFIVNRFDIIRANEKDKMKEYAKAKLTKYSNNEIFFVSALKALEGKEDNDEKKLMQSGMVEFESKLADFLIKEKGRAKLEQPTDELESILQREALNKAIPKQEKALSISLDDVKMKLAKAKPALEGLRQKKEQLARSLNDRIVYGTKQFERIARDNIYNLKDMVSAWIEEYQLKTKLGLMSSDAEKKAAAKEVFNYISNKIEYQQQTWRNMVLKPAIDAAAKDIFGSIEGKLGELFSEIDQVNFSIYGNQVNTSTVPTWERVAGVLGGLAIGDIGMAASGGINGISSEMAKTLAIEFGAGFVLGFLGLFNPVTALALMAGAIFYNWNTGTTNMVTKFKENLRNEAMKQLEAKIPENAAMLHNRIENKFREYANNILSSVDIEINETENQVKAIIAEKEKGEAKVNERLKFLADTKEQINSLISDIDAFRGSVAS